ncbi:hypothetical protein ACHAWF_003428, partial [Thalassiosira exigua]
PLERNNYPTNRDAAKVSEADPSLALPNGGGSFVPRRACRETCCVESVAVSIAHERRKVINTVDGNDLADLRLQHYDYLPSNDQLTGFAPTLKGEMVPCLLPGTIVEIDNHLTDLDYFSHEIRPKMKHPYVAVTMESDANSPQRPVMLQKDGLLAAFHGTNPLAVAPRDGGERFRPMSLGLSFHHPQEKYLLPYLRLSDFANPFAGNRGRWDVARHPVADFAADVFVSWGNTDLKESRGALRDRLCAGGGEEGADVGAKADDPDADDAGFVDANCRVGEVGPIDIYSSAGTRRFAVSPMGVGWDCYRTYEMLLLGVVPVVFERELGSTYAARELFEGLPVVVVGGDKSHADVGGRADIVEAIQRWWREEVATEPEEDFGAGWDRLFLYHRRRMMLRDSGREEEMLTDADGNEYYQAYRYTVVKAGGGEEGQEEGPDEEIFCGDHDKGSCATDRNPSKLRWEVPTLSEEDEAFLKRWNDGGEAAAAAEEEEPAPGLRGSKEPSDDDDDDDDDDDEASAANAERPGWWKSSESAVIAMAAGYGLETYRQFVGSLRTTGYRGKIILGVSADMEDDVRAYLREQDVTTKELHITMNCTYAGATREDGHFMEKIKCAEEYPDYKLAWGRFPLSRDWLLECADCTGGVMLTDTRDSYFQTDPFEYPFGDEPLERLPGDLMVFQEISNQTTDHWITYHPVKKCRGVELKGLPMLCSGSTMGTRQGILDYVNAMVREFDYWKDRKECRSDMAGDDQSIHNYLYYTGRLGERAYSVPHRTGPIHVVGWQADKIFRATIEEAREMGHGDDAERFVNARGYVGWDDDKDAGEEDRSTNDAEWLPSRHGLIDPETGLITNLDGMPSPQVHQFDRFGVMVYGRSERTTSLTGLVERYHHRERDDNAEGQ